MIIKSASVDRDQQQKIKERQESRKVDSDSIKSGEKSPEEMNKENAFFLMAKICGLISMVQNLLCKKI